MRGPLPSPLPRRGSLKWLRKPNCELIIVNCKLIIMNCEFNLQCSMNKESFEFTFEIGSHDSFS